MENPFIKRRILSLLILAGISLIVVVLLFWREMVDVAGQSIHTLSAEESLGIMQDDDSAHIREVRFEREGENIAQIRIGDLQLRGVVDGIATFSFKLSSISKGNAYPSIRVSPITRSGRSKRLIEFSPRDYQHNKLLSSEIIQLNVPVQPGDVSFSVSAFYPED